MTPSTPTRPIPRRLPLLVLLLLALLGAPPALAAPEDDAGDAAPSGRTTWSIAPVLEEGDEETERRISLRMEIEPGESAADAVILTNFSDRPATFVVYASDGVVTADGQFDVLPSTSEPADAGTWIAVGDGAPGEPITVEVGAESDVTLPVEVTVPENATPGDHPAGVVAALANEAGGVGMESRVGTRVHLRVAGDLAPVIAVEDLQIRYEPSWNPFAAGELHLDYRLENTGNVRLGAETSARGAALFGVGAHSGPGSEHREILPGQEVRGSAVLGGVWPLIRSSGELRAVPVVVGEDVVDVPLAESSASWSAWTVPWLHLLVLVTVLLAVLARRKLKARQEARTQARIDAAVAAAKAGEQAEEKEENPAAATR